LLNGFVNPGTIYFSRELEFKKQFQWDMSRSISDIVVSLSLVFFLRNVWVLVIGMTVSFFTRVAVSYFIHPYRPGFSFNPDYARSLFRFGKWVFGSGILVYLLTQGDDAFVGKFLGVTALGFYRIAYRFSNLPATHITHVISRVTFPMYSKLQDDIPKLREAYLKVLQITAFLAFPLAGLIFILAPDFTRIFLGEKWLPMVPAMQVLVIGGAIRSIGATIGPAFQGIGRPDILTKSMFVQLLILMIDIYPLTFKLGITGTSIAVVIPGLMVNVFLFYKINMMVKNNFKVSLVKIGYPFGATLCMILGILGVKKLLNNTIYIMINFALEIITGVIVFLVIIWLLEKFLGFKIVPIIKDIVKTGGKL